MLALFQTNKPAVFLSQGANSWSPLLRKSVRNGLKIIWLQKRSCWQTSLHPGLSTSWCVLAWSGWPAFTGFRTTLSPITTCIRMEHCERAKNVKQGWGRPFRRTNDKNIEAHDEKLFLFQSWNLPQDLWTAASPTRPHPGLLGIPGPSFLHHPPLLPANNHLFMVYGQANCLALGCLVRLHLWGKTKSMGQVTVFGSGPVSFF